MIQWFTTGSLTLIFVGLIVAGLGVPVPEDVLLMTGGAIAERGGTHYLWVTLMCSVGVLVGDLMLFHTARRVGPALFERRFFHGLLPPERKQKVEAFFERHGLLAIFIARHVAGLRAAVFALAGVNRVPASHFVFADGLGILVSVPLFVWLGFAFSENLEEVQRGIADAEDWLLAVATFMLGAYGLWVVARRWTHRRH
jgi:membrane protein DedA with SNARE-associated domain